MADEKELWNWKKLFSGIFVATNYGKALVLGLCLTIMVTVALCVFSVVKSKFCKPKPTPITQTESVGTIAGDMNKTDSHDTSTKEGKSWSLLNILCKN